MIPRGDHGACITGLFLWFSDVGHFLGKWRYLVSEVFDPFSGKMVVWAIIWDNGKAWF